MHLFPLLPFVCGLGFRKARALREQIRATGNLISRKDLLDRQLMPPKVRHPHWYCYMIAVIVIDRIMIDYIWY